MKYMYRAMMHAGRVYQGHLICKFSRPKLSLLYKTNLIMDLAPGLTKSVEREVRVGKVHMVNVHMHALGVCQ